MIACKIEHHLSLTTFVHLDVDAEFFVCPHINLQHQVAHTLEKNAHSTYGVGSMCVLQLKRRKVKTKFGIFGGFVKDKDKEGHKSFFLVKNNNETFSGID